MRKCLIRALALIVAALMTAGCALAEQPGYLAYNYTPTLITSFELSPEEWLSSGENRALATILVAYDMMGALSSKSDLTPDLVATSYVGRSGDDLMFYLRTPTQDLLVRYTPKDESGDYQTIEPLSGDVVSAAMERICPDGSYANDILSMYTVIQSLRGVLHGDEGT